MTQVTPVSFENRNIFNLLGSVPKKCIPKSTSFETHVNLKHHLFIHQKPFRQNPRHIQQSSPFINRLLPNKISPKNKHITASHPPSSKTTSHPFPIFVGFVPKPLPKPTNSHELLGFFCFGKMAGKGGPYKARYVGSMTPGGRLNVVRSWPLPAIYVGLELTPGTHL